jgi:hypothetical protein
MTTLIRDGFTYDTETRQVTFTKKVCWDCKGSGKKTQNVLCPHYHQPVRKFGGICPVCKSKNRNDHKIIRTEVVTCYECEGTGETMPNMYESLDFSDLIQYIEIKTFTGMHNSSFNEGYLGIGIIGGYTDYGRYLDTIKAGTKTLAEIVLESMQERNKHVQAGNLLTVEGKLIPCGYLKLNRDGWSVFSQGAYFQRNRE